MDGNARIWLRHPGLPVGIVHSTVIDPHPLTFYRHSQHRVAWSAQCTDVWVWVRCCKVSVQEINIFKWRTHPHGSCRGQPRSFWLHPAEGRGSVVRTETPEGPRYSPEMHLTNTATLDFICIMIVIHYWKLIILIFLTHPSSCIQLTHGPSCPLKR